MPEVPWTEDPGHESRLVPELELLHSAGREQPLWPKGPKPLTSLQPHHFLRRTVRPREALDLSEIAHPSSRVGIPDTSAVDFNLLHSLSDLGSEWYP